MSGCTAHGSEEITLGREQVIRAGQSKTLYRQFCAWHGRQVELPRGEIYALFPDPVTVLELPDEAYTRAGLAFKRRPLRAAAHAYIEHGEKWRAMEPADLVEVLQEVRRSGPWTAA